MKIPRKSNNPQRNRKNVNKSRKVKSDTQVTEMLKMCLQKVCELQQDLERSQDHENDPQAAGYAACAVETLRFLANEGLPPDHPIVKTLSERLNGDKE